MQSQNRKLINCTAHSHPSLNPFWCSSGIRADFSWLHVLTSCSARILFAWASLRKGIGLTAAKWCTGLFWGYTHWLHPEFLCLSRLICNRSIATCNNMSCRVIHSLPLRMSAIHVMQDSKIVALSHLIGSDQLPNSKSVVRKQPFFGAFLCLSLYSDRRSSGTHEVWVLNTGSDIAIAGLFARQWRKGHFVPFRVHLSGPGF